MPFSRPSAPRYAPHGHAAIATYERVREIGKGGGRYFTDVARLMPFTMGVIVVLLFLFMSGLYLDLTQPL